MNYYLNILFVNYILFNLNIIIKREIILSLIEKNIV